jgi:hypothetical protein
MHSSSIDSLGINGVLSSLVVLAVLIHFGFSAAQLAILLGVAMKLSRWEDQLEWPEPPDDTAEDERVVRRPPP